MPSLTLLPLGDERSTMRRHLLGRLRFGMTPIGLNVSSGREGTAYLVK